MAKGHGDSLDIRTKLLDYDHKSPSYARQLSKNLELSEVQELKLAKAAMQYTQRQKSLHYNQSRTIEIDGENLKARRQAEALKRNFGAKI